MSQLVVAAPARVYGAVAAFDTPEALLDAVAAARARGYSNLDAYTPFPIHGIDEAMGAKRSGLGWIALVAGVAGAGAALLLQWWTGSVSYPLVIGGKPFFAFEFSVPVTFELTVLFAAFGTVIGMLLLNGLPRFYHPVFQHSQYHRATDDRFLLAIESDDAEDAAAVLEAAGGRHAEVVSA
jgi:hypothetical protein